MRKSIGGVMVLEVPPDFAAYLPETSEEDAPIVLWWAHVRGKGYTPVYAGSVSVHSERVFQEATNDRGGY